MPAQIDLDAVVAGAEAFNRRDVDGILRFLAPEVELVPFAAKLAGTTYVGEAGVRQFFADLAEEWEVWSIELDDVRAVRGSVLAVGRIVARGRETHVDATIPAAWLYTMRNGRIARLESFDDLAGAEAACALRA
jgi:ketosteroid isomerase-like protein